MSRPRPKGWIVVDDLPYEGSLIMFAAKDVREMKWDEDEEVMKFTVVHMSNISERPHPIIYYAHRPLSECVAMYDQAMAEVRE